MSSESQKNFASRLAAVRERFGDEGPMTTIPEFSRQLAMPENSLRNWEIRGHRPQKGLPTLVRAFEPLRARGVDPRVLAEWVFNGVGDMPGPTRTAAPASSAQAPETSATVFFKNTVERIAEEGHDGRKDPKVALALIVELCKSSKLAAYLLAACVAFYVVVGESFSYLLHHRDEGETGHHSGARRICPVTA